MKRYGRRMVADRAASIAGCRFVTEQRLVGGNRRLARRIVSARGATARTAAQIQEASGGYVTAEPFLGHFGIGGFGNAKWMSTRKHP
jgi:hypothetical protein